MFKSEPVVPGRLASGYLSDDSFILTGCEMHEAHLPARSGGSEHGSAQAQTQPLVDPEEIAL